MTTSFLDGAALHQLVHGEASCERALRRGDHEKLQDDAVGIAIAHHRRDLDNSPASEMGDRELHQAGSKRAERIEDVAT